MVIEITNMEKSWTILSDSTRPFLAPIDDENEFFYFWTITMQNNRELHLIINFK